MDIKTLDDLETLYATFVGAVTKQIQIAQKAELPDLTAIASEKVSLLAQLRQQLDDTVAAQDLADQEYATNIQAQKRAIASLQKDMERDKGAGKRAGVTKAAAARRRRSK